LEGEKCDKKPKNSKNANFPLWKMWKNGFYHIFHSGVNILSSKNTPVKHGVISPYTWQGWISYFRWFPLVPCGYFFRFDNSIFSVIAYFTRKIEKATTIFSL
jgi:hypothetical protein